MIFTCVDLNINTNTLAILSLPLSLLGLVYTTCLIVSFKELINLSKPLGYRQVGQFLKEDGIFFRLGRMGAV